MRWEDYENPDSLSDGEWADLCRATPDTVRCSVEWPEVDSGDDDVGDVRVHGQRAVIDGCL